MYKTVIEYLLLQLFIYVRGGGAFFFEVVPLDEFMVNTLTLTPQTCMHTDLSTCMHAHANTHTYMHTFMNKVPFWACECTLGRNIAHKMTGFFEGG